MFAFICFIANVCDSFTEVNQSVGTTVMVTFTLIFYFVANGL